MIEVLYWKAHKRIIIVSTYCVQYDDNYDIRFNKIVFEIVIKAGSLLECGALCKSTSSEGGCSAFSIEDNSNICNLGSYTSEVYADLTVAHDDDVGYRIGN